MAYDLGDTIAAIASASGGAARGMIRVSGPAAADIVAECFVADDGAALAAARHPVVISGRLTVLLVDGPLHELPCDLFFWPTRRSYTREPVAELHLPGSPPALRAALEAVCRAGARLAEPGEYTLRAFVAGRLDLTQAEAVLGVIDAHGDEELRTATEQLAGNLARPLHHLREELLQLLAELEAGLDFVEEDIEFIVADELVARLGGCVDELVSIAGQMASRASAVVEANVVLVGPPNVGKSSLFNALVTRFGVAEHAAAPAIVSAVRGTTRDYLTAMVTLRGCRCELTDTAGIEATPVGRTPVDAAAQGQATDRHERAIVRIHCVDATSDNVASQLGSLKSASPADIVVLTKLDAALQMPAIVADRRVVATSSVTGLGLDELASAVAAALATTAAVNRAGCVAATADRCRDSLRLASGAVARAAEIAAADGGNELVAAEIRDALAELGRVVGAVYTDDLLDRVFSSFCIGK